MSTEIPIEKSRPEDAFKFLKVWARTAGHPDAQPARRNRLPRRRVSAQTLPATPLLP